MSLRPDLQQWYSVFLTKQEAARAVRTGFVLIRLSDTFDSCTNSVVDAIECYACKLAEISSWIPYSVQSVVPCPPKTDAVDVRESPPSTKPSRELSLEALAELGSTLRPLKPLDEPHVVLLRRLVSDAAVVYSSAISDIIDAILGALNWDDDAQEAFRDNAILNGCNRFLVQCPTLLQPPLIHSNWYQVSSPLRCCLMAASAVVASRPLEYRTFFGNGSTLGDAASQALVDGFKSSDASLALIPDLVNLCRTCVM